MVFRKKKTTPSVLMDMATKQKRYEALVSAYHADVYRYTYWLCGDQTVAEDLVQETFLRAWKSLDALQEEQAAKAWLITIARRENARRFERKQFDLVDIDDVSVSDSGVSNEEYLERAQIRRQMAALPEEYREPLLLQVVGGFSGDEIAEILDLNKNTVMTRLFRARNQLKDALEETTEKRGFGNG